MAGIVGQGEFGIALMKALGLQGQKVRSIDIHCATHELVTVKVERLLIDKEALTVTEVFDDYVLEPKPSILSNFDAWFNNALARAGYA